VSTLWAKWLEEISKYFPAIDYFGVSSQCRQRQQNQGFGVVLDYLKNLDFLDSTGFNLVKNRQGVKSLFHQQWYSFFRSGLERGGLTGTGDFSPGISR
jgi:hypothetical protein